MLFDSYRRIQVVSPINIALIKYWGKIDNLNILPFNDSVSFTLDCVDICTNTILEYDPKFNETTFLLNGKFIPVEGRILDVLNYSVLKYRKTLKSKSCRDEFHFKITSTNNFPTAAGFASSASGYCALAIALGRFFQFESEEDIISLARRGSGSAIRSYFGGVVRWNSPNNHSESPQIVQLFPHNFWPDLRILICIINSDEKKVGSTFAMDRTMKTSELFSLSRSFTALANIEKFLKAFRNKNFHQLSELIMKESNQLHAVCLDSYPPILYLNEASHKIINMIHELNALYSENIAAYTFDAGPNAFIICEKQNEQRILDILSYLFETSRPVKLLDDKLNKSFAYFVDKSINISPIVSTRIGQGPEVKDII